MYIYMMCVYSWEISSKAYIAVKHNKTSKNPANVTLLDNKGQ